MTRQSPFDDVEAWLEQMSRQFEEAAQRWGSGFETRSANASMPQVDLVDADDEFVVTADLPGFETDDVDVYITDQTLSIDAERSEEADESDANYVRRERSQKSVSRRIRLPSEIDDEDVAASMTNGVLTVHVGKADPITAGHRIDID
ncbi:Hsp20/alpha crystallin family protein [Haloarcula nitratireducens]|uniref:Hsp20/alpha crystallin family protein n=1 Tax=Haloarcula nitratireducens TaxID=2487749 RepID=A0AAW4P948_9EURY|nr:Hsp20/alpha crystallin family protein [Halomicroarcula nitratireducens]MBX0294190.1 Hsp20/alpha crystallin family protein [Halomicroarcula nitratireducens]